MRFVYSIVFSALFLASFVASFPRDIEQQNSELISDSRTYTALKNYFNPWFKWFKNDLPQKTPSDFAKDIKETAYDVKDWAENNSFVKAAKKAIQPVHSWIKDTASTLKDKSFRDMYEDTKEVAGRVDQNVGGWIDKRISDVEQFKK